MNEIRTEIDDRFMNEWIEFGMREMDAYLAKQARFARYLSDRTGGEAAEELPG
jgi:hypothetical protein